MTLASQKRAKRRHRSDGERTHGTILETAARLASVEGIHGLTLGRLAQEIGVSKSGLYAHFGSKEQLQLETIEAALVVFDREVVQPAMQAPEGIRRLQELVAAFFSYLERWVFPGGCFFASLLAEVDARSGPIQDLVVSLERTFLKDLAALAGEAQRLGEIGSAVDVEQLAFELYACMELTNFHFVLFRDPQVLERGRRATTSLLNQVLV